MRLCIYQLNVYVYNPTDTTLQVRKLCLLNTYIYVSIGCAADPYCLLEEVCPFTLFLYISMPYLTMAELDSRNN